MPRLFFAVLGLFIAHSLGAQFCGTPQQPLLDRIDALMNFPQVVQRSAQKYIPVTFHLVADNDGNGRIQEEAVLNQLANLNNQYSDQQALFYLDSLNYFNNTAVYSDPASNAARTQMRLRQDPNSVNIFITNTAENGSQSPGVVLAYYDPQEDWIVSRKDQINGGSSTLAHEVGHFFSLPHPHAGWDCYPYTTDDYTNPINRDYTIQCDGGGGSLLIELQNGSNCMNAGDRICDTPPDYNIGLLHQNGCAPNTTVKDKNGEVITPITNNFMGYYRNCSSYIFTPNQKTLINADFFSFPRMYLRTGKVPNTDSVEAPVTYITPINGEETPGVTNILLDWEDTPGATHYMVNLDIRSSFTLQPQKFFVKESQVIIDELPLGVVHYWRVWPYNESETGAGYSPTQTFRVGSGVGVNEIGEINDYSLMPNPTSGNSASVLTLTSLKNFNAELIISNTTGQVFSTRDITVPSGYSQHEVESENLPAGIYFIVLRTDSGILVERLLIMQ